MKVLSLFDGMSCGMLAMIESKVPVDRYVAYEIDKYAIQTSQHNFPMIEQKGDVFTADFTQYKDFDFLIGGSPCTYWSIAQTKNRETEASGLGWELFSQYVRALHEAQPKFFIYENNKSMAKAIRDQIRKTFGFEEICINSALVSAQNRQRYYWVGKRNEDGSYSKVDIEQPKDRGVLLRDVLDNAEPYRQTVDGKGFCLDASYTKTPGCPSTFLKGGHARANRSMVAEPVNVTENGKAHAIKAQYFKNGVANFVTNGGFDATAVSEPVCMRYERTAEAKACRKAYEAHEVHHGYHELSELHPRTDGKTNTLSTVLKDNPICEPLRVGCMPSPNGDLKGSQANRVYSIEAKAVNQVANGGGLGAKTGLYAVPVEQEMLCCCSDEPLEVKEATVKGYCTVEGGGCVDMTQPNSKTRRGRDMSDKCNCLTTSPQYYQYVGTLRYATPCEWDENGVPIKAISGADGKTYTVYPVKDGQITIKGKTYPIRLIDGYYVIRKLTIAECKRLQTVPDWFEFPVSSTQAYRQLGNGWTVSVISHLIDGIMSEWLREVLM